MQITSRQWRWLTVTILVAIFLYADGPETLMFTSPLDSIGMDVFTGLIGFPFVLLFSAILSHWIQPLIRRYLEPAKRCLRCLARAIANFALLGARLFQRHPYCGS